MFPVLNIEQGEFILIEIRSGIIVEIVEEHPGLTVAKVAVEGEEARAIHYPAVGGPLRVGQRVILNTTAKSLGLGTGGYHFVLYAEGNDRLDPSPAGHIMKLRYTPYQMKVLSVEEEASPYHETMLHAEALHGMPVIVVPLHSMVPAVVAVIKALAPAKRVGYLMSDGAALPAAFSRILRFLTEREWIDGTITFGHAFGGSLEAVNIYTALLAARHVWNADIAVVGMGPGIVGTGTPFGFTGVEQADFLHAVSVLDGRPIAVPRISFADMRPRHQGISHHSQTILGKLTLVRCQIAIPQLEGERAELLDRQLAASHIRERHQVMPHPAERAEAILREPGLPLQTMGRGYAEEREFFLTAGLAGELALRECRCQAHLPAGGVMTRTGGDDLSDT